MSAEAVRAEPPHRPDDLALRIVVGVLGLLLVGVLLSGCTVNLVVKAAAAAPKTPLGAAPPPPPPAGPNPCITFDCGPLTPRVDTRKIA
jgi:hypothetical protein